jgi:hypothetical protein
VFSDQILSDELPDVVVEVVKTVDVLVVVVVGFDKQRVGYLTLPFTQERIPKGLLCVIT